MRILIIAFIILFASEAFSMSYNFVTIDNSHGLSNNQIKSIFKDSKGFMWFSTGLGLNRFDGINFKVYKHRKEDSASSPYNDYSKIQEDSKGRLWLSFRNTDLKVYDLNSEKFINNIDSILTQTGLPTNASIIEIGPSKELFCYYPTQGIFSCDLDSGEIKAYNQSASPNTQKGEVMNMKISKDYIWVLYASGFIERINISDGKVSFQNSFFEDKMTDQTMPKLLFVDNEQDIWMFPGMADKGAAYYDFKLGKWVLLGENGHIRLSHDFIRCIEQDDSGLIWIGTDHGGVHLFNKQTKEVQTLKHDITNSRSIGQNSVVCIFRDNQGIMWLGTYKDGISYYHPNLYKFHKNKITSLFQQNIKKLDCNRIYMDAKDNLWVGTNGQGLIKYNEAKDIVEIFRHNPANPKSISTDIITSLEEDRSGKLWIGTYLGGLNSLSGNNEFTHYQIIGDHESSLLSKSVYGLVADNDNNLWIGTLGGGLDMYDIGKKEFKHYNKGTHASILSNYILSLYSDKKQDLYISTDHGVNVLDIESKTLKPLFSSTYMEANFLSNNCNNVIVDSRNLIWTATDQGINVYNPTTKELLRITETEGLANDMVMSLVEDDMGNVWAGTENGLSCVYCSYSDNCLEYYINNFDEKDGLPNNVCNLNASYKDKNGLIYIGFTKGYVCFNPTDIKKMNIDPVPQFTDLYISNRIIKPQTPYNGRVIIKETMCNTKELTLNYDEVYFTVLFSTLNYVNPQKTRFKYRLKGTGNQWNDVETTIGAATFSDLNPGNYRLMVYAGKGNNEWSEVPAVLIIIVQPPFWLSWWAYLVYSITFLLTIGLFIRWRLHKQLQRFEQERMLLEINKKHEVDELKIRFFTNISHEFKTPLTLILTPVEKLLKDTPPGEQKTLLTMVYRNAQNLLNMVTDILDFRKIDLAKKSLNLSKGDVITFVRNICQSFSSLAAEKSIDLTFTTFVDNITINFDPDIIDKIVTNLLSNAIKYTETGSVDVSIGMRESMLKDENSQNYLSIKVKDTGVGIAQKDLEKVFERFYRVENSNLNNPSGTGIGLHLVSEYVKLHLGEVSIESALGKGTTLTVLIPINNTNISLLDEQNVFDVTTEQTDQLTVIDEENTQASNLPILLVIDDNDDFCQFISSLFIKDYRIITAGDGKEAYSIVLDQIPDIILCDVMMPVMNGYEFCKVVKEDIRTSHIPVILLTAKASEENHYSGIEAGADDYIAKPFNIDMLKLKISKIIEKQKNIQSQFKKKINIAPSSIEIKTMDQKFMEKAIAIVEENIGNSEFLVEDLCKEMAMSRVYFYKKILALTDKTPSEFIRFIRLTRAAELLEKSQMFVNEIAFQVGFNDPKYFRKYFKNEFGVTPNEYKKKTL